MEKYITRTVKSTSAMVSDNGECVPVKYAGVLKAKAIRKIIGSDTAGITDITVKEHIYKMTLDEFINRASAE